MSGAASAGDHASDWSLAIHFNAFGWSPAWSLVVASLQVQLQRVAMQATGRLPFTSILYAGCLYGRLCIRSLLRYTEPGIPGEVASGKVKQLLAIDQTSDWLFAIYFVLEKSVACSTECSICFNCTLSICVLSICFYVLSSF